jgi:hypothetical protein
MILRFISTRLRIVRIYCGTPLVCGMLALVRLKYLNAMTS